LNSFLFFVFLLGNIYERKVNKTNHPISRYSPIFFSIEAPQGIEYLLIAYSIKKASVEKKNLYLAYNYAL